MKMVTYIEVEDGEIERILSEIREAEEKIYKGYSRLKELGVLKIKTETASGN